ncbi:amino acid adenylation domain-containing protein [Micromonospora sp. NBC_01796]|uniref:amino acid adenylation domain-containing protein n=1 Tax=Micromonospora sp. NBC_01796 TaxID=2975987 RepID=UPI002DDB17C0|nr:amino acid adenylation domain-containing protein [Micromonospora sp. NBC_01796]WSA83612.1 amino acid adenylation domain-containing protein [Micromonospora sp. NBC_01796]
MSEGNGTGHTGTTPNKRALLARMLTERANAPRTYPVSFGQQRLWFLDRFQPGDPVYNIPVAFRLRGLIDVDALRAALELIVRRHGALRTTFADSGGEPVQVVRADAGPVLEITDLTGASADDAARLLWQEARRPFDLAHGPLFRARLVRTADDDHHLSLCLHHIVSDAWSLGVLFTELNTAYGALCAGRSPQLPDLPAQYADYALWQREKLAGPALRDQLDYWLDQLRGAPALLTLPTDRPRPAAQSYRGAVHYWDFSAPLLRRIQEFNQSSGATMFMTLMAAFTALLSRSSGQDELVVGTPVAGRNHADLEPLIGFFVNTLPLRVSVAGLPSFRELVDRVREATLGGLANGDVPFEKLVEELAPERSLGHAPVFQTQLIVQNTPPAILALGEVTATSLLVDSGTAKFDLSLVGEMTPDGVMHMAVEYDTALFDADTVARLARQLTTLLDVALADPDRSVAEIPLLAGVERWRSVVDWNNTARGLPPVASVLELLPTDDSEAGGVPAVSGPDGAVDPAELHQRAARLAYVLRARGVAPDSPVGICLERGVGMLVGVLGAWQAGAGYLPLDPSLPADRLRYLLDDSGATVVVTQRSVREKLADLLADVPVVICLDDDAAELAAAPADADPVPAHPDGLAYLIYTSGSTGRPKGVAVPHRAVLNLVASFHDDLGLTPADRFAAVTTLSFDISVLELLVPLLSGTPLTIVDTAVTGDGTALRQRLVADGITAMQATPATWRLLLATGGVPERLRLRLCGGEALPRDLADALIADGATLWNCYGPTETTVWSAATPVAPSPAAIDLGTPIANTELYVLDRIGQPVPVGVVGEVHIGGLGVVRGYPGRPGLTASRFVPDPFTNRPGARLYATGDLARQRADGRLEFLGRTDHQVKIRGFRIELGEIEEQLRAHDLVTDAVVTTWAAGSDDTRLVAYVVPSAAGTADLWSVLRPWLATRLPGYMVPATLVTLSALPVNANGKTDRGALPQPDWRDAVTVERVAPRNPVEQTLADIWQQVLGVERVGVHDDFFQLGGHSLLAAQALSRIGTAFEMDVPIRVLFEAPTVATMTDALVAREPVPGHVVTVAELRRDLDGMSTEQLRSLLGEPS